MFMKFSVKDACGETQLFHSLPENSVTRPYTCQDNKMFSEVQKEKLLSEIMFSLFLNDLI